MFQLVSIRPATKNDDISKLPLDIVMQRLAMLDPPAAKAIKVLAVDCLRKAQDAA